MGTNENYVKVVCFYADNINESMVEYVSSIFFPPGVARAMLPRGGEGKGGDSMMNYSDDSDKYLDYYEKGWGLLSNWIVPALIFIAVVAIALHSYFNTIGG